MLRTIEARYDHGNFVLLEKFPKIDTASLLIIILDDSSATLKGSEADKTTSFLKAMNTVAGAWKSKKMDVETYIRDLRQDRDL